MKRTLAIIMVLLLACAGVVSANLVNNPSFETPTTTNADFDTYGSGTIGPWNVNNIDHIRNYWVEIDGVQSIDLSSTARGDISQTIVTTSPGKYDLTFNMSGNFVCPPTTKQVAVYWDSNPTAIGTATFTKSGGWSTTNMEWTTKSMELPHPSGPSTVLKFVDISPGTSNCGVALDNIVVEPQGSAIPEFPTIALPAALVVGLIGAVLFIRKSKEE